MLRHKQKVIGRRGSGEWRVGVEGRRGRHGGGLGREHEERLTVHQRRTEGRVTYVNQRRGRGEERSEGWIIMLLSPITTETAEEQTRCIPPHSGLTSPSVCTETLETDSQERCSQPEPEKNKKTDMSSAGQDQTTRNHKHAHRVCMEFWVQCEAPLGSVLCP